MTTSDENKELLKEMENLSFRWESNHKKIGKLLEINKFYYNRMKEISKLIDENNEKITSEIIESNKRMLDFS